MPWYFPEGIKKRACRYLLQRYLGQFLRDKLPLDHLSVDLYNGTGTLNHVGLDVETLNEWGETYNLPIEFVDGYIDSISVNIPWSSLLTDNSYVEVQGLNVTIQPKERLHQGSMFESMWGSMTTSMQLAEECLKQENDNANTADAQPFEGLERFALTIDSVLCRTKVRFIDTVVRLEHVPKESKMGMALEMRIKKIDYLDEAGADVVNSSETARNIYVPAAFATKRFYLEGVSLYSDEFPCSARTFSRLLSANASPTSKKSECYSTAPVSPVLPPSHIEVDAETNVSDSEKTSAAGSNALKGSCPVLIGKWMGRQEIRLQLKQADSLPGPKVDIEVNLGSNTYFLSPRQVHVLVELLYGLMSPDLEDDSNTSRRHHLSENQPMEAVDFERVEEELQKQMQQPTAHPSTRMGTALHHQQGWSSQCLDDSDEDFHPLNSQQMTNSMGSDMQSSLSSLASTTLSGSGISSSKARHGSHRKSSSSHQGFEDAGAELTHYKVRVSDVTAIVLHDDILTPTAESEGLVAQSSVNQMKALAEQFFVDLATTAMTMGGSKATIESRDELAKLCKMNHLRLSASPVVIEGNERTTCSSACTLVAQVTCGHMEVLEVLQEEKHILIPELRNQCSQAATQFSDLLVFEKSDSEQWTTMTEPCFKLKLKHVAKAQGSRCRGAHLPTTDLHVTLAPCSVEVDISILDRITALLHPQPLTGAHVQTLPNFFGNSTQLSNQACFTQAMEDGDNGSERIVNLKLSSSKISFKVRFPIPDLRALHDMERAPWWQRSIRKDILMLQLTSATIGSAWDSRKSFSEVEFRFRKVEGFYQDTADDPAVAFLVSSADDDTSNSEIVEDGFGWPRLLVRVHPVELPQLVEEEASEDSMDVTFPLSFVDNMMFQMNQSCSSEPSPFSQRRVVYENQHTHRCEPTAGDHQDPFSENEKMIMPGDKVEMLQFVEKTSSNCHIRIEATLPNLVVVFPSKHFYEVLYNRLSTDLFLWEPTAPKPSSYAASGTSLPPRLDLASTLMMNDTIYQTFSLCKSTVEWDSSSESEDETHIYHSVYEHRQKHRRMQANHKNQTTQNNVAVMVNSNSTKILLHCPYMDSSSVLIPDGIGVLYMEAKDSTGYILSGFQGKSNSGFICLQSNQASLYHEGSMTCKHDLASIQQLVKGPPPGLVPTVVQSGPGTYTRQSGFVGTGPESLDVLSLAIRFNLDSIPNIKTFQVALGMRDATLHYRLCPPKQNWINQFIDFFDVRDLPVAGYAPPTVVTELHLHLWGCAIDYRPLYLPLRAMITVESFSISSNITAQTSSSLLRFIAEEMSLFISNKTDAPVVDLKRDYVCVVDLGFFDLSLRITDGKDRNHPRVDLQACNSIVHIRTCSDSCAALQDLLTYFASDGDLLTKNGDESNVDEGSTQTASSCAEENGSLPGLIDQVHSLMAEAMLENSSFSNSATGVGGELTQGVENRSKQAPSDMFLFPDESGGRQADSCCSASGDPSCCTLPVADDSSTDEGFCILEDDPGIGIRPKSGKPEVRMLTAEPIQVIENHFSVPMGKIDQLKAPKHFPTAVLRYTLQEMSLVWHMHGGSDFDPPAKSDKKGNEKQVKMRDPCDNIGFVGVAYSKSRSSLSVQWQKNGSSAASSSSPNNNKTWQMKGGSGRRHDILMELQMNKVRFRYEVYPESAEQAARQVLLIHEFEIRDRLATSQFNKFLYQYTSEDMPRQSNANMLVVKALHVRPDPALPAQECSLRVALLPLRLNIDQDALLFLYTFFTEISSHAGVGVDGGVDAKATPSAPIMTTTAVPIEPSDPKPQQLLIMLEETQDLVQDLVHPSEELLEAPPSAPMFFRSFVFAPEVLIRLDYQGKHVDTQQLGTLAGLLMGLGQLNCSELRLKRLAYRHGLLGTDKLLGYACTEWLEDIRKNQLPGLLGGVGPCYSVVQFVRGIRDLLWLPIEQYRKDGRIVRGLQRGANAFTKSTAMAALELTNRLVQTIQSAAETAYDMVSPGPSIKKHGVAKCSKRKRPSQPVDIREGVANAYQVVKEGLGDTARTLVRVASEEHEHKGISGAVGGVLRQIPPTVVKPIILATEATSNVLGGMRHQLVPDARREAAEKWRSEENT